MMNLSPSNPCYSKPLRTLKTPQGTTSLAFFPSGDQALHVSDGDSKIATVMRILDGSRVGSWSAATCIASVSQDGKWIVCGHGGSGKLRIYEWNEEKLEGEHIFHVTREGHGDDVTALDVSSSFIASGSWNSSLILWSLAGQKRGGPLYIGKGKVIAVRFSPNGDYLAACARDAVSIWKIHDNGLIKPEIVRIQLPEVTTVAWSHNGRRVFAGSEVSALATVFDVSTGLTQELSIPCPHSMSSCGNFIVCSSRQSGDGVQLLDATTHAVIDHIPKQSPLALSSGGCLVTTNTNQGLAFWSLPNMYGFGATATVPGSRPEETHHNQLLLTSSGDPLPRRFSIAHDVEIAAGRSWDDWLHDAERAIRSKSNLPQEYDNYVALRAARPHKEGPDTFISDLQHSKQAVEKATADAILDDVFKRGPRVLIDTRTGCLCDASQRKLTFKTDPVFSELFSSAAGKEDEERIRLAAEAFCQYVTFSHTWHGDDEPSFQYVSGRKSVHNLEDTFVDNKLRKFFEIVRALGYWWAWSDTCCIDKLKEAVLREAITSMYRWYKESALTLALLADVTPEVGDLIHSRWMQRAWTLQELIAPRVILFYDSMWQPYRNDPHLNHKNSPLIRKELLEIMSKTTTFAETTLLSFDPNSLTPREKLRLASTRKATRVEDITYSLLGIFGSDIVPNYGEENAALGRLLQEIVERNGEVTILNWTGHSSEFNSSLPADIVVYQESPEEPSSTDNVPRMQSRIKKLRNISSAAEQIYRGVVSLPRAHFTARCLRLPCIVFPVITLRKVQSSHPRHSYCAKASAVGKVDIVTDDLLPLDLPADLLLVHPWIHDLRHFVNEVAYEDDTDIEPEADIDPNCDEIESDTNSDAESALSADNDPDTDVPVHSPLHQPANLTPSSEPRGHTKALGLIVCLQQQFTALLLQKQSPRTFKRLATDYKIVVQIRDTSQLKDIYAEVLEIL